MTENKDGIRLAKLAAMLNISSERITELLEKLGMGEYVEHTVMIKEMFLDYNLVKRYLEKKNWLSRRIFTELLLWKIIPRKAQSNRTYTLDELKEEIDKYNAENHNTNVNFSIRVSDFIFCLNTTKDSFSKDILEMKPDLPTQLYVKANVVISEQVVREICKAEGISYEEVLNKPTPSYIEPRKVTLEGPKVVGTVDFNSYNGQVKPFRLAKASIVYNKSIDEIVRRLKQANLTITNLPTAKLTPEMVEVLDKEFNRTKECKPIGVNLLETKTTTIIQEKPIDILKNSNKDKSEKGMMTPIQKILFGSPGTGKSYKIVDAKDSYFKQLVVDTKNPDLIKTVFHPEYTYGDFMGKLMPLTDKGGVTYEYYAGHFMQALGTAFKNIIKAYIEYQEKIDEVEKEFKSEIRKNKSDYTDEERTVLNQRVSAVVRPKPKNVLLVIDEINRGNSAAIFGTAFQLLDRDSTGWSSYPVKISDLELKKLISVIGLYDVREGKKEDVGTRFCGEVISEKIYEAYLKATTDELEGDKRINLIDKDIKLPPNLSVIATMNTSDNSIYFMDSAFKRRWDWEFIDISSEEQKSKQVGRVLFDGTSWQEFVDKLNLFIKDNGAIIRKIEDKQIGYFFIKDKEVTLDAIKNKLLFFLWDSIFSNDKKPLERLLGGKVKLVTFGDFVKECENFVVAIKGYKQPTE